MTAPLLTSLWTASWVMGVLSVSAMLLVVGRRAVLSAGTFSRSERRDAVLQALLTDWSLADPYIVRQFVKREREVALLVTEFSSLVRGPELARGLSLLEGQGAVEQLLSLLRRGNTEDKLSACEALSLFNSDRAAEALRRAARHARSRRLRIAAVRALIQMGKPPPIGDVIGWMRLTGRELPAEAFTVLKLSAHENPHDALARIVAGEDPAAVRAALIWAISEDGTYEALPVLSELVVHNDPRIRIAAIHAIGEMRFIPDRTLLHYCLADGQADVRSAAAEAIGKIGDVSALRMLSILLDDPEWDVRFRAANALVELGEPGMQELDLAAADTSRSSRRARAAAIVLSERRAA